MDGCNAELDAEFDELAFEDDSTWILPSELEYYEAIERLQAHLDIIDFPSTARRDERPLNDPELEQLHEEIGNRIALPNFSFVPLVQTDPSRLRKTRLPEGLGTRPIGIFWLFFTNTIYEQLCVSTNDYSLGQNANTERGNNSQQYWRGLTPAELKVFEACLIHMGIQGAPAVVDYWNPPQKPMKYLSHTPFEQIKQFFHIAGPGGDTKNENWYLTLFLLAGTLRNKVKEYIIPSRNVAIDEMMVGFRGQSAHTVKMPNKPIKKGYKLWAIAGNGYVYDFVFYSLKYKIAELRRHEDLTLTSSAVLQLAKSLDSHEF